jgi:hypothetical protein
VKPGRLDCDWNIYFPKATAQNRDGAAVKSYRIFRMYDGPTGIRGSAVNSPGSKRKGRGSLQITALYSA